MSAAVDSVRVHDAGLVRTITLDRVSRRNALDEAMMNGVRVAVADQPGTCRLVVVRGAGTNLCAGADLHWMRGPADDAGDAGQTAARREAAGHNNADALAGMFAALAACRRPLVVVAHGAVRGGGCGLVAVADVALASDAATFGFPEVRLGLSPAVIAPYVLERLAPAAARAAFLGAQPMNAARALQLGLVDEVVPDAELEVRLAACCAELLAAGPQAVAETKALLRALRDRPAPEHGALAAKALGRLRRGPECAAGVAAFFARRPAPWCGGAA